jgi:branched-chain amino acid transport system substrate-binding protein
LRSLAGCGGAPAPGTAVIKIGQVSPLTGPQAHLGKDNDNGARLAIEELNAKGVTIGGVKVKFELVSEDDQADPKTGTIVAQKLVDAKVAGVIGHLNSGTTIPASKIYNDAGIRRSTVGNQSQYTLQGGARVMANDAAGQGARRIRGGQAAREEDRDHRRPHCLRAGARG